MAKIKTLTVIGTRPEAIKMAPLVKELEKNNDSIESYVCITAQHRQMLDQVLSLFKIEPDYDLNIMKDNQDLWSLTSNILLRMKDVYEEVKPDLVLVHGDTTTTLAASLSAFYAKIPVGHVEAGLRTFDKYYPFPEEINRVVTDAISSFYFAPTEGSKINLLNSGAKEESILVTGNTVIDSLLYTVENHKDKFNHLGLDNNLKTILLTSHRRENFGKPLENVCEAILDVVHNNPEVQVVFPVHLNPVVRKVVYEKLDGQERIHLIEPLDYAPFALLMQSSYLIITDSGGIQEEAPSLGKPVLVLREETERPEAVKHGTVKLVGTDKNKIIDSVQELLTNQEVYNKMSKSINPYGDGLASKRIVDFIKENKICKQNLKLF